MLGLLLLAFLVIPLVELYVFVQVAEQVGFAATVLWIVGVSVIGAWLVKREGLSALRRANDKVAAGSLPTDELVSGVLILVAGALLLTPGFFTDSVGVLLLFPPSRALLRGFVRRRFSAGPVLIGGPGFPGAGRHGDSAGRGEVWDAESWEDPPDRPGLQ